MVHIALSMVSICNMFTWVYTWVYTSAYVYMGLYMELEQGREINICKV